MQCYANKHFVLLFFLGIHRMLFVLKPMPETGARAAQKAHSTSIYCKNKRFFSSCLAPKAFVEANVLCLKKYSPSIFQWNRQWIHKRSCESVSSFRYYFFSIYFSLFSFRLLACSNSKVSPRSIILWRYLNVSFCSTFSVFVSLSTAKSYIRIFAFFFSPSQKTEGTKIK